MEREAGGERRSPHQDFEDLKEQTVFIESVAAYWFADLREKKKPKKKKPINNDSQKLSSGSYLFLCVSLTSLKLPAFTFW